MKKKSIVIWSILLISILALVYWWGGNGARMRGWTVEKPKATQTLTAEEKVQKAQQKSQSNAPQTDEEQDIEKPEPVNTEDAVVTDKKLTCTITVRCDTILSNMEYLDPDKKGIIPADGVILQKKTVAFNQGESVFDVLLREMQNNKIHMEYVSTPVYNSVYIEGIANLYEFDCGELSGWMYSVNGWFPNYGCSRYQLKQGDNIEWHYTCDLGVDVGGFYSTGNNQ